MTLFQVLKARICVLWPIYGRQTLKLVTGPVSSEKIGKKRTEPNIETLVLSKENPVQKINDTSLI